MEEKMMTKQEYEAKLEGWGEAARIKMKSIISSNTHGTGSLAKSLRVSVSESKDTTSHAIAYKFHRYGVFRAYGVGRGWRRTADGVMRVGNVGKDSALETILKKRGYTKKDISQYVTSSSEKPRKPLDWFDSVIQQGVEELHDIVTEYYGDYAMEDLLDMMKRVTIKKEFDDYGKQ